jgi:hypothetical protein
MLGGYHRTLINHIIGDALDSVPCVLNKPQNLHAELIGSAALPAADPAWLMW